MEIVLNPFELSDYEMLFIETWKGKLDQSEELGYFQHCGKDVLQYFRSIANKIGAIQWPLVECSGCTETVDMVHYVYEQIDELSKQLTSKMLEEQGVGYVAYKQEPETLKEKRQRELKERLENAKKNR